MSEVTKVDKEYIEAFNLGYELAKELKLNSPMFKDLSFGNDRINAMQSGMEQYRDEIKQAQEKAIRSTLGLDNDNELRSKETKSKDKGLDMSI